MTRYEDTAELDALRARLASLPVAELAAYGRAADERWAASLDDLDEASAKQATAQWRLLKATKRWREWCDEGRGGEGGT